MSVDPPQAERGGRKARGWVPHSRLETDREILIN